MNELMCSHGVPAKDCAVRHTTKRHCEIHDVEWDGLAHAECWYGGCATVRTGGAIVGQVSAPVSVD